MNAHLVIPNHGRSKLLGMLLTHLSEGHLPAEVKSIQVIENGSAANGDLVAAFAKYLPVVYQQTDRGNKSAALNLAVESIPVDDFVIFFDDDIVPSKNVLQAYVTAVQDFGAANIYGGPCTVRYETPPSPEVRPLLNLSNRGFDLELTENAHVTTNYFLGFNWGCFHRDLLAIGRFDPSVGPGAKNNVRGQETFAQLRMRANGCKMVYVADAWVEHFVPKKFVEPNWLVKRRRDASQLTGALRGTPLRVVSWLGQWLLFRAQHLFSGALRSRIKAAGFWGLVVGYFRLKFLK